MQDFELIFESLLINTFGINQEDITDDAHFYNDLGLDSLDMVELSVELEKVYKITIYDDDIDQFKTINDVKKYIMEQQKNN